MPSLIVNGIIIRTVTWLEKGLRDSKAGVQLCPVRACGLHFEIQRVLPWVGSGGRSHRRRSRVSRGLEGPFPSTPGWAEARAALLWRMEQPGAVCEEQTPKGCLGVLPRLCSR